MENCIPIFKSFFDGAEKSKGTAAFVSLANVQPNVYCFADRKLANNLSLLAISSFVKTSLRSKYACKMAIISEFIDRLFCFAPYFLE